MDLDSSRVGLPVKSWKLTFAESLVVGLLAFGVQTACVTRLAPGVSCASLRQLRYGDSMETVTSKLGPPFSRIPGEECTLGPTSECWRYFEERAYGTRVWVEVDRSKGLQLVHVVYRPLLGQHETLFVLDNAHSQEGRTFNERIRCQP